MLHGFARRFAAGIGHGESGWDQVSAAVIGRFVDGDRRTDMDHGHRWFAVLGTPGADPLAHPEIVEFVPAGCENEKWPVGEPLEEVEEHGDPGAPLTGAAEPAGEWCRDQQLWALEAIAGLKVGRERRLDPRIEAEPNRLSGVEPRVVAAGDEHGRTPIVGPGLRLTATSEPSGCSVAITSAAVAAASVVWSRS